MPGERDRIKQIEKKHWERVGVEGAVTGMSEKHVFLTLFDLGGGGGGSGGGGASG